MAKKKARRKGGSALGSVPRQQRRLNPATAKRHNRAAGAKKAGGALGNVPRLEKRANRLQRRIDQRAAAGKGTAKAQKRLDKISSRMGGLEGQQINDMTGAGIGAQPETGGGVRQQPGVVDPNMEQKFYESPWGPVSGIFDNVQNQGQFDPAQYQMAFEQQRKAASDRVMQQFDRQMAPQFERENQQFEQRMAEQGIPMGSELYDQRYEEMKQTQNAARQNAMDQAYQTGAAEQSQAFNQAYQGYQLPTQQAAALSPYYNAYLSNQQFGQNLDFQGQQNALDRQHQFDYGAQQFDYNKQLANQAHKHTLGQIAATPRGGGGGGAPGLSYEQRLGLLDREFYNNMVMQGLQNGQGGFPQQGYGTGFGQGFGQGIGAGLVSTL